MLLSHTNPDSWYEPESPDTDFRELLIRTYDHPPNLKSQGIVLLLRIKSSTLERDLLSIRAPKIQNLKNTYTHARVGRRGLSFEAIAEGTAHHNKYPARGCRNLRWNVDGDGVWLSDESFKLPWRCEPYQYPYLQTAVFHVQELERAMLLEDGKPYLLHLDRRLLAFSKQLHLLGKKP